MKKGGNKLGQLTKEKYYNENTAEILLGCIFRNLALVVSQKYPVNISMFVPDLHKMLFVVAVRLYRKGRLKAMPYDIEEEVNNVERYKDIWDKYNGEELVAVLDDYPDASDNYGGYWNTLNNNSTLRDLRDAGFSVDGVIDLEELHRYDAKSIIDSYASTLSQIRTKRDTQFCREEILAGDNTEQLLEQFEQTPFVGAPFPSSALTTITNGLMAGTLHAISASSGTGKTNLSVSAICRIGVSHYWSFSERDFVENPDYDSSKGSTLYVHTEMSSYEEINPKFLACISGVDVKKITLATYTPEEKKRVIKAGRILKNSKVHIVAMPDFTTSAVIEKAQEIKHRENLSLVIVDYMEITNAMISQYRASDGETSKRHDQILLSEMTNLKAAAEELDVCILTYTQTNGSEREVDYPDAGCIAGFKACQNKLDSGAIMLQTATRKKEAKIASEIISSTSGGFGEKQMSNIVLYTYKVRAGTYKQRLKIFCYFDYSVCRIKDLCVLDSDNNAYEEMPWHEYDIDGWCR